MGYIILIKKKPKIVQLTSYTQIEYRIIYDLLEDC